MAGCRPFTPDEVKQIRDALVHQGPHGLRNVALHVLGCHTGYRIAELLRLRRCDVLSPDGTLSASIAVRGKRGRLRSVQLHRAVQGPLLAWLVEQQRRGYGQPGQRLFPIASCQALKIIRSGAKAAGLRDGGRRVGTHSWRKTFAQGVYMAALRRQAGGEMVDPLVVTMKALGHSDVATTARYLTDTYAAFPTVTLEIQVMA